MFISFNIFEYFDIVIFNRDYNVKRIKQKSCGVCFFHEQMFKEIIFWLPW